MVGAHGDRAHFHLECMAHVDPVDFVAHIQAAALAFLSTVDPQTSPTSGDNDNQAQSDAGSDVEPGEAPASRSRGAGAKPGRVERLRAAAAEAV